MKLVTALAIGVAFIAAEQPAKAHDVAMTRVRVTFAADHHFEADLYYDVDAFLAGVSPGHLTDADVQRLRAMTVKERDQLLESVKEFTLRRVRLRFDGNAVDPNVEFPERADASQSQPADGTLGSRFIRLTGTIPPGAKTCDFWASRAFANVVLEISDEGGAGVLTQILEPAERSQPYIFAARALMEGRWRVAARFVRLGFEHIIPEGLDHMLFVLGLFLLSTKVKPLLWQVTAFTVAHCITLALSTYGVVRLSPSIVEPLIALSIAFVAIENVCTSKLHPWRPAVVFLFGLLHGLGFAGALQDLGLPQGRMVTALASFNVGVELGQLAVIGMAMILVGWAWRRPWYRRGIVVPASLAIAGIGLYWSVTRAGFLG